MDIILAVVLFFLTAGMAYLGVHVTLHPPSTTEEKDSYKTGFAGLTVVAALLIMAQSYLTRDAQAKLQLQLSRIQTNTEQPPKVIVENRIDPAAISDAVQKGAKAAQSAPNNTKAKENPAKAMKMKALTLSTDILTFLSDREKGRPKASWALGDFGAHSGETLEQYNVRTDKELKDYQDYELDTRRIFQDRYWPNALQVLLELKQNGFSVEPIWYQPVTAEQIRDFALGVANLAEKSPP